MRRPGWLAALLVLTASASLLLTASAEASSSPQQRQLVSAYAPILMHREQVHQRCDTSVEQYKPPTTVDTVLGNPAVRLVHYVGGKDVVVKRAPTAADIAGLGDDYYLDLPGDPLGDHMQVRQRLRQAQGGGQGAGDRLRPHCHRARLLGPRRPVLLLLLLQPVQRPARGRLGGDADRLRRGHAGRGAATGPVPGRALPACWW